MMIGTSLILLLMVTSSSLEPEREVLDLLETEPEPEGTPGAGQPYNRFIEADSQRFDPHNHALPQTPLELHNPNLPLKDYEPVCPEVCEEIFQEMLIQQRMMQAYRCPRMDRLYHFDPQIENECLNSTCGQTLMSVDFYKKCNNDHAHCVKSKTVGKCNNDRAHCVESKMAVNCSTWGVYGAVLGDERENNASCVCQLLQHQSSERLKHAKLACPQFLPKLICIPNMVTAISLCSWPGTEPKDIIKCIADKMDIGKERGSSIPLCYIQMCHALEDMFGEELEHCSHCEGRENKRTISQREWYRFPGHDNTGDDLQLVLPLSSRDVTYSKTHPDLLQSHFFTDYADPQACNRFIRCFNNGPCFNGTDGGSCPPGEHFQAFPKNPIKNGCYAASKTDCGNAPVTRDSLGSPPVCFAGNEDFSDMVESVRRDPVAIRTYVGHDGTLQGLGFGYHDRDRSGNRSIWGPVHGASSGNETIKILKFREEIRAVHGETIKANTDEQQVVLVRFDIFNTETGQSVESVQYGEAPATEKNITNWTLAYPDEARDDSRIGCPLRFICGSKTRETLQVLTVHFEECVYTKPRNEGSYFSIYDFLNIAYHNLQHYVNSTEAQ